MHDWLAESLDERSGSTVQVMTASRRLARELNAEYARRMVVAGKIAWRTPAIRSWQDWPRELLLECGDLESAPTRISPHQSRLLWERCLRREVSDPLLNIGLLARQSRDAWQRLQEWRVSLTECEKFARNRDQRIFARAARSYLSILEREKWVDDAGLADLALSELAAGRAPQIERLTLAGFDRISPQLQCVIDAVQESGGAIDTVAPQIAEPVLSLRVADNRDAELRAAGAWAREQLAANPGARVAIVVTHLEQGAPRSLRMIKEGLIPGWQNASQHQNGVVNISYGRKLAEYPAIAIALRMLRWLHSDLTSRQVSMLLQSAQFGVDSIDDSTRQELRLRQLPDQLWSPQSLLAELGGGDVSTETGLDRIRVIAACRSELPQRQAPAEWVSAFSQLLQELSWPGTGSLGSTDFQLINRWRELLNDVARLQLVSPSMTCSETLGRIQTIANETVYQPEAVDAVVQVMGPLEAAGMQFDRLWVTGISSDNWPPPARPLVLVSRDLQREAGMPDSTPADTLDYSSRVINRLAGSSDETVFSYPAVQDDAQQSPSELLSDRSPGQLASATDPGWHAAALVGRRATAIADDPVPPVDVNEKLSGGAATIQRQFVEPFAAFVTGRLGVRPIWPIANGLPAHIRGSLIHKSLHRLYEECPSSLQLRQWDDDEIDARAGRAIQSAFWAIERNADEVLLRLLALEKRRVQQLLSGVIEIDAGRDDFRIDSVEKAVTFDVSGIRLQLRVDRIDIDRDGECLILDYKTGAPKKLLDRDKQPKDMQLVVYACSLADPVGGIALMNIDSREIVLEGAGRNLTPGLDWDSSLRAWKAQIEVASREIAAGDIRINPGLPVQAARPLAILSRYRELPHAR